LLDATATFVHEMQHVKYPAMGELRSYQQEIDFYIQISLLYDLNLIPPQYKDIVTRDPSGKYSIDAAELKKFALGATGSGAYVPPPATIGPPWPHPAPVPF
jgi:hypothetical protein